MPELPEVETIKRELSPRITGKTFAGLTLNWLKMAQIPPPEAFESQLKGKTIIRLDRRGKYLIMRLSSGETLILHFRMSGSLLFDRESETDPYIRAVFHLDDGARLYFRDPRKLGVMWLVKDERQVVGKLGPEPLDAGYSVEAFSEGVKKRSAPIKAVLLDQGFLAGVGNMYADEALFASRIHPARHASSLSRDETQRLFFELRRILKEAIECYGASVSDYRRPSGRPGEAQFEFKVAHRYGEPCPICSTPIARIAIRQRGTYFCPTCQSNRNK
jgi:formamidopyrimidine-DNA glycosylase